MRTFRFIGDLSRADVDVLAECAEQAESILEYGAGGSTQILAQAAPAHARIVSVDTEELWIERTRANLFRLGIDRDVEFMTYSDWAKGDSVVEDFDLVFDDGFRDNRLPFALRAWERLRVGGRLLMHDTRRSRDMRNVLSLFDAHAKEVEYASFNCRESNITVLRKRRPLEYVNWNKVERKAAWQIGRAPVPMDAFSTTNAVVRQAGRS